MYFESGINSGRPAYYIKFQVIIIILFQPHLIPSSVPVPAGLSWSYCLRSPLLDTINNLFFREINRIENIMIAFLQKSQVYFLNKKGKGGSWHFIKWTVWENICQNSTFQQIFARRACGIFLFVPNIISSNGIYSGINKGSSLLEKN